MISPTNDPYDKEVVLDELGDKVTGGLVGAVVSARMDLSEYRDGHPSWVAAASERGLADWIHDRLWDHFVRLLDDLENVVVCENGSTREILVGDRIRIRAKRHDMHGSISTFPTQTALWFYQQSPQPGLFNGMTNVNVVVGYVWMRESREIGSPVVSLRDGVDNVLWMHELPEPPAQPAIMIPSVPDAPSPTVVAREETKPSSASGS